MIGYVHSTGSGISSSSAHSSSFIAARGLLGAKRRFPVTNLRRGCHGGHSWQGELLVHCLESRALWVVQSQVCSGGYARGGTGGGSLRGYTAPTHVHAMKIRPVVDRSVSCAPYLVKVALRPLLQTSLSRKLPRILYGEGPLRMDSIVTAPASHTAHEANSPCTWLHSDVTVRCSKNQQEPKSI